MEAVRGSEGQSVGRVRVRVRVRVRIRVRVRVRVRVSTLGEVVDHDADLAGDDEHAHQPEDDRDQPHVLR